MEIEKGSGTTTSNVVLSIQPNSSVPITEYISDTSGDTEMVLPLPGIVPELSDHSKVIPTEGEASSRIGSVSLKQ